MTESQFLMTTVPWSPGWRVTVDGVKQKAVCAAGSFLGVETGPGTHSVCFEYIPSDFYAALIISMLSFIIAMVFMLIVENNRRKAEAAARDIALDELEGEVYGDPYQPEPMGYYMPEYVPMEYMPPPYDPGPNSGIIPELVDDSVPERDEYGYYEEPDDDDYDY